jgi:hypothetical protein
VRRTHLNEHHSREGVDERSAQRGATDGDDEPEVFQLEGEAVHHTDQQQRGADVHLAVGGLVREAEQIEDALAQPDEIERVREDDRRADAQTSEQREL